MRYRLRTLLIVLAVLPPACGIVPLLYRELDPSVALTFSIWLFVGVGVILVIVARRDRLT